MVISKTDGYPDRVPGPKKKLLHSNYLLREMIALGKFEEAMQAIDKNLDHLDQIAEQQRDLYNEAAKGYVARKRKFKKGLTS